MLKQKWLGMHDCHQEGLTVDRECDTHKGGVLVGGVMV